MKFNSTYTPVLNLKQTLSELAELRESLVSFVKNEFDLTRISPPAYYNEDSELLVSVPEVSRKTTFDLGDEYEIVSLPQNQTNWLRGIIDRVGSENNEGFYSNTTEILRDTPETTVATPARDIITFQIKIDSSDNAIKIAREFSQKIYSYIYNSAKTVEKKYGIKNIFPPTTQYISAQQMENELPFEDFKKREAYLIQENTSYIFESPGKKLYSGKIHKPILPQVYDINNYYIITLLERFSAVPLHVVSVGICASGQTLRDQVNVYGGESALVYDFYNKQSLIDYKVLEIRVNFSRLAMAILAKGHIGEVQSGITSNESKIISDRYKVEII